MPSASITPSAETDSANKVAINKDLTSSSQLSEAQVLSLTLSDGSKTLTPASETDGAQPVTAATFVWRVVGAVQQDHASVGAYITHGSTCAIRVATDSGFTTGIITGDAISINAHGRVKPIIDGLAADTQYWFRLVVDGVEQSASQGRFKTAPVAMTPTSFEVGFGSCMNASTSTGLTNLEARDPDLFVHLGDLQYWDDNVNDQNVFRANWDSAMNRAIYKTVFGNRATSYVWSDHDFGGNNSDRTYVAKNAVNAVYREVYPHYPLNDVTTGSYQTFVWGRIRFIVTDGRSFRDPYTDLDVSGKTMLGTTQKQWLKDTITEATESLIIWCHEDPWIETAGSGTDAWGSYSVERAELGQFFLDAGKPIVLLSGDMHAVAYDDGTHAVGGNSGTSGGGISMVCQGAPFNQNASIKGGPYTQGPYPASGTAVVQQYGYLTVTDAGGTTIDVTFNGYDDTNTVRATGTKTISVATGVSIFPAAETETANLIAVQAGFTPAEETDAANTPAILGLMDPAVESDQAQLFTNVNQPAFSPALETDEAVAFADVHSKFADITPAGETDTTQAQTRFKSRTVTPSVSTNAAQLLTFIHLIIRTLATVDELDKARALVSPQSDALQPAEPDTMTLVPAVTDDVELDWTHGLGGLPFSASLQFSETLRFSETVILTPAEVD